MESIAFEPPSTAAILAVGGEVRPSLCMVSGADAWGCVPAAPPSDPEGLRSMIALVAALEQKLGRKPDVVACDMHPDYAATRFAKGIGIPVIEVQHHHAHIAGCMLEHGLIEPVIGVCCDGTGYGTDGAVWGCEILHGDRGAFRRMGHLDYFPLLGGDAAAIDTWRPAAGLLYRALGPDWRETASHVLAHADPEGLALYDQRFQGQRTKGQDTQNLDYQRRNYQRRDSQGLGFKSTSSLTQTSSLGRLFDAVAFLLGLCDKNSHDAEAPRAVESAAKNADLGTEPYPITLAEALDTVDSEDFAPLRIDPSPMIAAMLQDRKDCRPVSEMAMAFHSAIAQGLSAAVDSVSKRTGTRDVVISGGCFFNKILFDRLVQKLGDSDYKVWHHVKTSTGDESLALGQAAVASMLPAKEKV